MSETEVVETVVMPDGTEYRAVLRRDPNPEDPPEDGGQWPIIRIDYKDGWWGAVAFNHHAKPYTEAFNRLASHPSNGHNSELFERYIAIFHGGTLVVYWGRENTRATDSTYLAFDTAKWRDEMGLAAPPLINESPLAEIEAWVEGDVWGYAIEKRWNPDGKLEADEDWDEMDDGYCFGYYGRKYAEEEARGELNVVRENHKVVHRYPEHEKITPHQREIDAILEFLGGLDDGDYRLAKVWPRSEFHGPHLQSVPESHHQRIVFEHFGIDYNKIKQEQELMLQHLQEESNSND